MSVLERILAYKREEVAALKSRTTWRELKSLATEDESRGFVSALDGCIGRAPLIAEIKKASPSKGLIRGDFDAASLAQAYERGGAACLSVLTDMPSFHGANEHLSAARQASSLPILRKDFMIDAWQIAESRAIGANAVLVIMAAVDDVLARELCDVAFDFGLDALIEVHDEAELDRAMMLEPLMIGINNRSLTTFETDLAVTERLAARVPRNVLLVSESGIFTPADITRLQRAGARAFLVGESLMRQADVESATLDLLGLRRPQ